LIQASDDHALNLFAPAYIRPVYDGGGNATNNTQTVGFYLNTESPNSYVAVVPGWDSRANNSARFWVAYILAAFQDSYQQMTLDKDASSEGSTLGSTASGAGGSLIYLESLREGGAAAAGGRDAYERRVVAHEVGHALRIVGDYTSTLPGGGSDYATDGLMHAYMLNGPTGANLRFIDADLATMRGIVRPAP
jgi:hypothetical protein